MTNEPSTEALTAELDRTVNAVLDYYEQAGRANPARIDRWGAWEVLAHFTYWHQASAWGIASATLGGPPWLLSGDADQTNDAALAVRAGESYDDLIAELRRSHARLLRVARAAKDLEAPAFRRGNGAIISGRVRLQTIADHWAGHLRELQQASG
jgi:hypothetical protein